MATDIETGVDLGPDDEAASEEADEEADAELPDNRLFEWYERYIGDPEEETDVYLGFGLFFGGIGMGLLALLVFLVSAGFETGTGPFWAWRAGAFSLGMVSLPVTMLGVVVLLPVERRALYGAVAGTGVIVAAVLVFNWAYPANFNVLEGADYSPHVVGLYALGMVGVIASTGAALVAHQLERAQPARAPVETGAETEGPDGESYSDDEIRADIDDAMEDVEITWGGVEKHEGTRLNFTVDETIESADIDVEAKTTRSSSTDAQVAGLKQLKGGEKKTAKSTSTVDDQTAKLNELRKQKREEQKKQEEKVADPSLLERIVTRLGF